MRREAHERRLSEEPQRQLADEQRAEEVALKERDRQILLRTSAMLLRPTRTGSFGESLASANQCASDPNAHLRPQSPSYTCRRDVFGDVNCNPY
jgi:hypothetical protein